MKHTNKTLAEKMINWMEEHSINIIRIGFVWLILELIITKDTPVIGLNVVVFGAAFITVPKIVHVFAVLLNPTFWKKSQRKGTKGETLEEHDKHCDFCKGWKEQFKKSRRKGVRE